MNEVKKINLLKAIFNFIKKFKPYATESEFIKKYSNKVRIDIIDDQFVLIDEIPPTKCRWYFDLSSLSLVVKVGNYTVNEEKYSYEEAIRLFEGVDIETFLELSDEELEGFYEAYALSKGEFQTNNYKQIYINYQGGNIEDFEELEANRFSNMRTKLISLSINDLENFIKAIISIEHNENDLLVLDKALKKYLTTDQPLINTELLEGEEKL